MHHEAQASQIWGGNYLRLIETPKLAPEMRKIGKPKNNKIELQRLGVQDALLTEQVSVFT